MLIESHPLGFGDVFARLGSFGDTELAPGLVIKNDDAANDFLKGVSGSFAGSWSGLPSGLQEAVRTALSRSGSDGQLAAMAAKFLADANALAEDVAKTQRFGWGGRGAAGDAAFQRAMEALRNRMAKYVGDESVLYDARVTKIATAQVQTEADVQRQSAAAGAAAGTTPSLSIGGGFPPVLIYVGAGVLGLGALYVIVKRLFGRRE